MTFNAGDVLGSIQVKADNQGTAANGDYVDVWIKWSPDGSEYDTDEHAEGPYRVNTYASDNPGEDPASRSIPIVCGRAKSYKLSMVAPQAGTRNIVVSAIEHTQRQS